MQIFMSSFASTQKTDPSLNDSLHTASEGVAVLAHNSPVKAAGALHDRAHQGGLHDVSTSVSMYLQIAQDKIFNWIEFRAAWRPRVHGDEVPGVLLMDLMETGNGA